MIKVLNKLEIYETYFNIKSVYKKSIDNITCSYYNMKIWILVEMLSNCLLIPFWLSIGLKVLATEIKTRQRYKGDNIKKEDVIYRKQNTIEKHKDSTK